jgi:uncharacterized phage infection (PIP) family protein YhgE
MNFVFQLKSKHYNHSVELDNYINALKQMDSQIDQQSSMQDTGKEEYKQTVKENLDLAHLVSLCYLQVHLVVILLIAYGSLQSYLLKMVKENLDKLREIIQSQESPFSKGMIEDYRKQLTESLQEW